MWNLYLFGRFFLLMKPEPETPTVLVAEDEALVRQLSVLELEDAGYHVIEAANAGQAIAILETGTPVDVLFTDVNMPGEMDGIRLARFVHSHWPEIRLIVTSGRADIPERDLPDDGRFLRKPYRLSEMSAMVGRLAASR
jgi:CheY-like chemotaxis protein